MDQHKEGQWPLERLATRRSYKVIAGLVAGGACLFSLSFYVSYSRPFPCRLLVTTCSAPVERGLLDMLEPYPHHRTGRIT